MRKLIVLCILLIGAALPAAAQPRLNLDFPGLADKADEVVDITLDASMLRMAAKFLNDADDKGVRDIVSRLEGIYVRSYSFDREGQYDRGLADRVRAQLGATWKPLVTVKSRTKENVNILVDQRGDKIAGLVIIAAEPREFTIVNLVGPIDIERLAELEGSFGIPRVTVKKENGK